MIISLREILIPQLKSKMKSSNGMEKGTYKFFKSSNLQLKFINDFHYDKESLIFGTGGGSNIHYRDEPFKTSTDCIVMYTNKNISLKFVYYYISGNTRLL